MMNKLWAVLLTLAGFTILIVIPTDQALSTQWEELAPGIEYREYYLPDPNIVYVARMRRDNPQVTIDTSIALGKLSGGLEIVRNQADRYDDALNYWGDTVLPHSEGGWGSRNRVVVAINGTFTLPPDFQQPWEGQVSSGWYAWRFKDSEARNTFVWKMNRDAFIGDCVRHPDTKQVITYDDTKTQYINGVNVPRGSDQLILYTPQYDRDTGTNDSGVEVLVELTRPAMLVYPEQVIGYIREVRNWQGSSPIPFDHIVLSGSGSAATKLKNNAQVGEQIGLSQFLKNCDETSTLDWNNTYASIVSNRFYFLKDGQFQPSSDSGYNVRNPRTAVVYNDEYIFFIVVDGRYPGRSIGMNMEHLADFTKYNLGALHGLSLDGGGSSTMVVNGEVVNFPSDGIPQDNLAERLEIIAEAKKLSSPLVIHPILDPLSQTVYLPYIQYAHDNSLPEPPDPDYPLVERAVPNGVLMVVVEPKEISNAFMAGDQVFVSAAGNVNIRLGPGTNYAVLSTVAPGTQGEIIEHMNGLNGVYAKGYHWWKIRLNGQEGWIAETLLAKQ
jgi:hypothetical protein